MKVYVDELPKGCGNCPCCLEFDWCRIDEGLDVSGYGSCSRGEIHPDCPLKLIANHDKQVRKEVCEEIRKFYTSPIYDRENAHTEVRVLLSRLDQIQGETK